MIKYLKWILLGVAIIFAMLGFVLAILKSRHQDWKKRTQNFVFVLQCICFIASFILFIIVACASLWE